MDQGPQPDAEEAHDRLIDTVDWICATTIVIVPKGRCQRVGDQQFYILQPHPLLIGQSLDEVGDRWIAWPVKRPVSNG